MEETFNSNETSDCELKSATLDHLFKEQVADLRDLVLKKADDPDIKICHKWLKVFNRTTKAEKIARNCLCTLMQQQIKEFGCLSEPFTDLKNCNKDLESVLRELDDQSQISSISFRTDSVATYKSHAYNVKSEESFGMHQNIEILKGCQNNQFNNELTILNRELENLRVQLTEKQIENDKLRETFEKCRRERTANEEAFLDSIKTKIVCSIRDKLVDLDNSGVVLKHMKLFGSIFEVHSKDTEFMNLLKKFDIDLQLILNTHFERELIKCKTAMTRQICRKYLKKKSRLRQKYERRLTLQATTQRLQLKLAKLKCFSEVRQAFIRSYSEFGKVELWEILNTLEEKYAEVVNRL